LICSLRGRFRIRAIAARTIVSSLYDPIAGHDGAFYELAHGSHITVREVLPVASGKELMDVNPPSRRVSQVALMTAVLKGVSDIIQSDCKPIYFIVSLNSEGQFSLVSLPC
jgi:hypothetical protein